MSRSVVIAVAAIGLLLMIKYYSIYTPESHKSATESTRIFEPLTSQVEEDSSKVTEPSPDFLDWLLDLLENSVSSASDDDSSVNIEEPVLEKEKKDFIEHQDMTVGWVATLIWKAPVYGCLLFYVLWKLMANGKPAKTSSKKPVRLEEVYNKESSSLPLQEAPAIELQTGIPVECDSQYLIDSNEITGAAEEVLTSGIADSLLTKFCADQELHPEATPAKPKQSDSQYFLDGAKHADLVKEVHSAKTLGNFSHKLNEFLSGLHTNATKMEEICSIRKSNITASEEQATNESQTEVNSAQPLVIDVQCVTDSAQNSSTVEDVYNKKEEIPETQADDLPVQLMVVGCRSQYAFDSTGYQRTPTYQQSAVSDCLAQNPQIQSVKQVGNDLANAESFFLAEDLKSASANSFEEATCVHHGVIGDPFPAKNAKVPLEKQPVASVAQSGDKSWTCDACKTHLMQEVANDAVKSSESAQNTVDLIHFVIGDHSGPLDAFKEEHFFTQLNRNRWSKKDSCVTCGARIFLEHETTAQE